MIATHQTIRHWCRKFGRPDANALRRRRPPTGDTWHLDGGFIGSNGVRRELWRAADQGGNVSAILARRRRDRAAVAKFSRRPRQDLADVPRVPLTDKRASYGAARRGVLPPVEHRQHKRRTNRAEQAHRPPRRVRAERRPLPPAPPPPDRRRFPRNPPRALRHLAGGHRHPGHGLNGTTHFRHALMLRQTYQSDFT